MLLAAGAGADDFLATVVSAAGVDAGVAAFLAAALDAAGAGAEEVAEAAFFAGAFAAAAAAGFVVDTGVVGSAAAPAGAFFAGAFAAVFGAADFFAAASGAAGFRVPVAFGAAAFFAVAFFSAGVIVVGSAAFLVAGFFAAGFFAAGFLAAVFFAAAVGAPGAFTRVTVVMVLGAAFSENSRKVSVMMVSPAAFTLSTGAGTAAVEGCSGVGSTGLPDIRSTPSALRARSLWISPGFTPVTEAGETSIPDSISAATSASVARRASILAARAVLPPAGRRPGRALGVSRRSAAMSSAACRVVTMTRL